MAKEHIAGRATTFDKVEVMEEHMHSISQVYPTLVVGIPILAGAAGPPWVPGNFVELIPVNTIGEDFDIHWLVIEGISNDGIYELVFYAATTEISRVRFSAEAGVGGTVTYSPIPIQTRIQPKNTQIQCKLACSAGAETATISVIYHEY
jgi:hypothetical protein